MPAIDMTEIYKKYPGMWVALNDEHEVLASGEDGKKVYTEAAQREKSPILYHVPKSQIFFVGYVGYAIQI